MFFNDINDIRLSHQAWQDSLKLSDNIDIGDLLITNEIRRIHNYNQQRDKNIVDAYNFGINRVCGTIENGFSKIQYELIKNNDKLGQINSGVSRLYNSINFGFSRIEEQLRINNEYLGQIAELLKLPDNLKQKAYHIENALKMLSFDLKNNTQEYYKDTKEELLKAISFDKKDPISNFYLGYIYLFDRSDINFQKASEHFANAAKFFKLYDYNKYLNSLSWLAKTRYISSDFLGARDSMVEDLNNILLNNDNIEYYYLSLKFKAKTNSLINIDDILKLIDYDKIYLDIIALDPDFNIPINEWEEILTRLKTNSDVFNQRVHNIDFLMKLFDGAEYVKKTTFINSINRDVIQFYNTIHKTPQTKELLLLDNKIKEAYGEQSHNNSQGFLKSYLRKYGYTIFNKYPTETFLYFELTKDYYYLLPTIDTFFTYVKNSGIQNLINKTENFYISDLAWPKDNDIWKKNHKHKTLPYLYPFLSKPFQIREDILINHFNIDLRNQELVGRDLTFYVISFYQNICLWDFDKINFDKIRELSKEDDEYREKHMDKSHNKWSKEYNQQYHHQLKEACLVFYLAYWFFCWDENYQYEYSGMAILEHLDGDLSETYSMNTTLNKIYEEKYLTDYKDALIYAPDRTSSGLANQNTNTLKSDGNSNNRNFIITLIIITIIGLGLWKLINNPTKVFHRTKTGFDYVIDGTDTIFYIGRFNDNNVNNLAFPALKDSIIYHCTTMNNSVELLTETNLDEQRASILTRARRIKLLYAEWSNRMKDSSLAADRIKGVINQLWYSHYIDTSFCRVMKNYYHTIHNNGKNSLIVVPIPEPDFNILVDKLIESDPKLKGITLKEIISKLFK